MLSAMQLFVREAQLVIGMFFAKHCRGVPI